MGRIQHLGDSLRNLVSNLGTARDKASHTHYGVPALTNQEATNAYRGSWLPRKIVDIPAMDACRNWRSWNAEATDISALEAEERRLGVKGKVLEAMKKARLYGGAAIYIGTGEADPTLPLDPERIGRGGIRHLNILSRSVLKAGPLDRNPESPSYGLPEHYTLQGANQRIDIHPSRLVLLTGAMHPDPESAHGDLVGWGDSVLTSVMEAIKNADGTAANVASLVYEAKVDVFKIPGLMQGLAGGGEYEQRLLDRLMLAATAKGINGALILDAEEDYQQKSASFAGLTDILSMGLQIVSGAADIPSTRLLGQAPGGLNSSGDSDLRNYYDRVKAMQELELGPAMAVLDECLVRSAMGSRPEDVFYEWRSLWQTSEKERADIGKVVADTIKQIDDSGLFPDAVWAATAANMLIESGSAPGLESALADYAAAGGPELGSEDEIDALGSTTEENDDVPD